MKTQRELRKGHGKLRGPFRIKIARTSIAQGQEGSAILVETD